jgi:hypothetical protein
MLSPKRLIPIKFLLCDLLYFRAISKARVRKTDLIARIGGDALKQNDRCVTIPVGVVIRRLPGVTRWAKWSWRVVAVLPGAPEAEWVEMRREGDSVEYHAATVGMDLWRTDTEAYQTALNTDDPSVYVVLRTDTDAPEGRELVVHLVTASPYDAQDYTDSGEEIVERVPMPPQLIAFVRDFIAAHHEDEVFVKRRRDKHRVDIVEDGKGDARISQLSDVYRAPRRKAGGLH